MEEEERVEALPVACGKQQQVDCNYEKGRCRRSLTGCRWRWRFWWNLLLLTPLSCVVGVCLLKALLMGPKTFQHNATVLKTLLPPSPPRPPPPPKELFHLHVPKTGTSIWREIIQYQCAEVETEEQLMEIFYRTGKQAEPCAASIQRGHHPLSATRNETTPSLNQTVTLLRRPVERIASGFVHNLHDCDAMQNHFSINDHSDIQLSMDQICRDIEAQVNTTTAAAQSKNYAENIVLAYAKCVAGCAANMLSGVHCGRKTRRPRPQNSYDYPRLFETLDSLLFVGITDRWEETVCLWHEVLPRLNGKPYLQQTTNTRQSRMNECKTNVKTILQQSEKWTETNDPDWRIYKHGLELFEQRLAASRCGS